MHDMPRHAPSLARHVLHDFGFFGHYLHVHAGGRSGQQHVLVMLRTHGGSMGQREIQERSKISSASISEVLAKLEAAGMVTRTRSDEDRRQQVIVLTEAGTREADGHIAQRDRFEERCLACLTEDEKAQLVGLLDRLVGHWESIEGEEGCA
jgi:DNA-binding MarR family transcriptional regulator